MFQWDQCLAAAAASAVVAAAADFIMLYVGELPSCPEPCLDCPAYLIRELKSSYLTPKYEIKNIEKNKLSLRSP